MNIQSICRYLLAGVILSVFIFSSCKPNVKKGQVADGTYKIGPGDTITDVKAIVAKVNSLVAANRLDDATNYISANIQRFKGTDKAILYNERGGAYFLKDDLDNAVADYLSATEIDSENYTYLINVAKTYESMPSLNNATFFAKKILDLKNVSDSDKVVAKDLILRCDRIHSGH